MSQEIYEGLAAPFIFGEEVMIRVGPTNEKNRREDQPLRGQPLYYVDARVVMDRLDSVCGLDGWQCTYTPGVGSSIICNIGVRVAGDWIWRGDGAGPSDMEAEKGALSDAFKRAAVRFGVARYLYDLKAPWVELELRGRSSVIPDGAISQLKKLHDDFAGKCGWGPGEGIPAYRMLLGQLKALPFDQARKVLTDSAALVEKFPPAMRKHLVQQLEK
jgi:hypothetical protein